MAPSKRGAFAVAVVQRLEWETRRSSEELLRNLAQGMSRSGFFVTLLAVFLQVSLCLAWHGHTLGKRVVVVPSATSQTPRQRLDRSLWHVKQRSPVCEASRGDRRRIYPLLVSSKPRGLQVGADGGERPLQLRHRMRTITGFSLTALRATLRAATGVSATAIYATALAATGEWIRYAMKVLLDVFPTWLRYFLQPFLVMYYVPLFVLRNLTGPTRSIAKRKHEMIMDGWREAVDLADRTRDGWQVHVHDGIFEKDEEGVDVNEAVAEAVQISLEAQESKAT